MTAKNKSADSKPEKRARVGQCDGSAEIPHDYVTGFMPLDEAKAEAKRLNEAEDQWTHQQYRVFPEKG